MKTESKILTAFILNLAFSIFEFVGGVFTGSVAIISDAVHDLGDAAGIGAAFFLERKSKKQPDEKYSCGYLRFSVLGSVITTLILLVGSAFVIYNSILRLFNPVEINYTGMMIFAFVGVAVNLAAALFTRDGDSLNQKAVNLHMLEDVLGWVVVLLGAVIMRFTDAAFIDPLMSIAVAVFILVNAVKNLLEALAIFLERTPRSIDIEEIRSHILQIEGVGDVHHIHVWTMDGHHNYATMHVVAEGDAHIIKERVREELSEHGIGHATLELEAPGEPCHEEHCHVEFRTASGHHHHHHHHHH